MAARSKAKEATAQETDADDAIDLESMLRALVNESVRSRLRHRALLDTLGQSGSVDIAQYLEAYKLEEERNFKPLLDLLLLTSERFTELHSEWIKAERLRFGYTPNLPIHASVSPAKSLDVSGSDSKIRRSSPRKANASKK